jgi:hypothetical protein
LYYYRARYYDATIGRFTSEDPLGLSAGDANLYRYVGNSPLNFTDPTGETSTTERAATQQTTLPLILHKANCLVDSTIKDLAVGTLLGGPALGALDVSFNIVSCGIFPTSIKMQATFLRLSGDLAVKLKRAASAGAEVVVELAGKRFKGTFEAFASSRIGALKARVQALGTDPARGFIRAEGIGGVRIEQTLGRTIRRSADAAIDFIDDVLGPISLKGPIPARGSVEGLANAAIMDARFNTATNALFVDLRGLSALQASRVRSLVESGTSGILKAIFFLD